MNDKLDYRKRSVYSLLIELAITRNHPSRSRHHCPRRHTTLSIRCRSARFLASASRKMNDKTKYRQTMFI